MRFTNRIDYALGRDDFPLPRFFTARQIFDRTRLDHIETAVHEALTTVSLPGLTGKRVALTAGSRGVANQAGILKAVAAELKSRGALPFIVPGMGSHGGATAEGQRKLIAGYGITEEAMGVPILSSMETVQLGTTASGFPVFCDRNAAEADYILPVHRIKPHTDFKAELESGPSKMLVIGLGKHRGATQIHRMGISSFATLIPEAAGVFIATGKVLGAVGVVENAYDETMIIEAMTPERMIDRERELLVIAKKAMAQLYTDAIDVLVIEEIGKDISGTGMDSNINARPITGEPGFQACPIGRIVLLGISKLSHGNGNGLGTADVVTNEFFQQIDLASTYINALTSRILEGVRIPLIANSDCDAITIAVHCSFGVEPSRAKIVHIADTLHLSEIRLSEPYLPLVRNDPRFEVLSELEPLSFNQAGRLARIKR